MPEARSPVSRFGRTLLFALLPLAIVLALLELMLGALDLGDPGARLSLTRGFSSAADYIVADPDVPGGYRTQMFNGENPEVVIPPKGKRTRVLLLGESNTEHFPGAWLEELLDEAAPDPGFEVINLGRRGYGSERVLILATQALVLELDVCVIYLGHNELIERGFALKLAMHWEQPWMAGLADRLSGLRTMNVLVTAFEKAKAGAVVPEAQQYRGDTAAFARFTHEQSLVFYEVYRKHYEALIRVAESHHSRVLISTLVSNDFDAPLVSNWPPAFDEEQVAHAVQLRGTALGAIPKRFRPGLIQTAPDDPAIHLRQGDWGEDLPPDVLADRVAENAAAGRAPPARRPPSARSSGTAKASRCGATRSSGAAAPSPC